MAFWILAAAVIQVALWGPCTGLDTEAAATSDECNMLQAKPDIQAIADPAPPSTAEGIRLFCFSLMTPWSYEREVMGLQSDMGAGIFGCDKFLVYSDKILELGEQRKHRTLVLRNTSLHCNVKQSALNAKIFYNLWKQVLDDQEWVNYHWSLKLDPDTVFFPDRFRRMIFDNATVMQATAWPFGTFLTNCPNQGLFHGPLEALSERAMKAFSTHISFCPDPREAPEDQYLRTCLWKFVRINSVGAFSVVSTNLCANSGFRQCLGRYAGFHPFKGTQEWQACHQRSEEYNAGPGALLQTTAEAEDMGQSFKQEGLAESKRLCLNSP
mmetsp:Transcript_42118/g.78279  ORF Transcript_42118/g.78279 Transcript_42118/m.78279 type:complete len:325 (-) Transcript_42118:25-999(-)